MNSLYELLDKTSGLADRRKVIEEYLESHKDEVDNIVKNSVYMEGCELTKEEQVPSTTSSIVPYAVGNKYLRDEPYDWRYFPAYILGVIRTDNKVGFLIAESDGGMDCIPRSFLDSPEEMLDPIVAARLKNPKNVYTEQKSKS
jgi:hypothetical protein